MKIWYWGENMCHQKKCDLGQIMCHPWISSAKWGWEWREPLCVFPRVVRDPIRRSTGTGKHSAKMSVLFRQEAMQAEWRRGFLPITPALPPLTTPVWDAGGRSRRRFQGTHVACWSCWHLPYKRSWGTFLFVNSRQTESFALEIKRLSWVKWDTWMDPQFSETASKCWKHCALWYLNDT